MAKRFIDTGLFDDEWYMDLTSEGKIFWMYCITKCDHAGILQLNEKLCQFQTGIDDISAIIDEIGDRIVPVHNRHYFIPNFIKFQYPGFPKSKVKQQEGAIKILEKFNLFDRSSNQIVKDISNSIKTVNKDLKKSYEIGSDSVDDSGIENVVKIDDADYTKSDYAALWANYKRSHSVLEGFEEPILLWLKYKSEKNQSYQPSGLLSLMKMICKISTKCPKRALEIIEYSMSRNYDGLIDVKESKYKKRPPGLIQHSSSKENSKSIKDKIQNTHS